LGQCLSSYRHKFHVCYNSIHCYKLSLQFYSIHYSMIQYVWLYSLIVKSYIQTVDHIEEKANGRTEWTSLVNRTVYPDDRACHEL